ncbi:MAG: hypothetical protein JO345_12730 [Streptosporangiaceae bacterium]|nr:hypothetical protein [Streptosporangiaceae bacterium]
MAGQTVTTLNMNKRLDQYPLKGQSVMTRDEHHLLAEQLLDAAEQAIEHERPKDEADRLIARAQVHAVLATITPSSAVSALVAKPA